MSTNDTMRRLNDAPVLDQLEGQWQKMFAIMLWKLAPQGIEITAADIAAFPPGRVLFTHGHKDSFEFKIVTEAEARVIGAHEEATNRGRA
jgi:hypothetical protein